MVRYVVVRKTLTVEFSVHEDTFETSEEFDRYVKVLKDEKNRDKALQDWFTDFWRGYRKDIKGSELIEGEE